ncbi:MAG: thymidine phosphorylase, partial [Candidatus Kerfeldbacteria bacterium]|nr:thymidine phosphorylase [Candidatus Kerfeldbacteria bacterium]
SGELGLFEEVWKHHDVLNKGEIIEIDLIGRPESIVAINKKMLGGKLSDQEIRCIVKDVVSGRLSDMEIAYFMGSGFFHPFSNSEIISMIRAVAETGEMLKLPSTRPVIDKHSVGGLAGNRTTMVIIPILASLNQFYVPKTSSRAITSPSGTADTMEVLAPVTFSLKKMREIVLKTGACLVWGGGVNFAPADDIFIRVTKPLFVEPVDKMIVSILSKKVAEGVQYLLFDIPYGPSVKIPTKQRAQEIERRVRHLARRFKMKVAVTLTKALEPVGRGVGPALEARDVLRVLQQKDKRPPDLQKKSVMLCGKLLELTGKYRKGTGEAVALRQLENGEAWKKMQEIIMAQGGDPNVDSDELTRGAKTHRIFSESEGRVIAVNDAAIDEIARTLGAPQDKQAGVHIHARFGQIVMKGAQLFTFYAATRERIELAKKALERQPIFTIR